ncbi:MAG TPA: hypothetical protein PKV97_00285 [Thauera aminoaromatica]|nr:hypothetical protein [Thauera aminoaromatica]
MRLRPSDFDPGLISDVTHTGTGQGTIRVTDLPYDGYVVELRCTRSGDAVPSTSIVSTTSAAGVLKVSGTPRNNYTVRVQIMSTGYFRYSFDLGATWSATIAIPASFEYQLAGTGLTLLFTGTMAIGDVFNFSTVGPAQFAATTYVVSRPILSCGTGTITPSGQVTRPYRIAVAISGTGGFGEAQFYYSVNGGAPAGPIPLASSYTIPCVGITLTFDPGCGPTYFGDGDVWQFSTRGSYTFDLLEGATAQELAAPCATTRPIVLNRPEPTGLRLLFEAQSASSPNYVSGDFYGFSTEPPPDILEACVAGSDELLAPIRARYQKQQIVAWDNSVTINAARISAESLYDRKGQNWKEDRDSFAKNAARARAWGEQVGKKLMHPQITAFPLPGVLAPRVVFGPDLEGVSEGPFGTTYESRTRYAWGSGIVTPPDDF